MFIHTGDYMLSSYTEIQAVPSQPMQNSINAYTAQEFAHISYDLNNYHQLLEHIANDEDSRWILFIAPPGKPNVNFLTQAGINRNRIITLPQNKIEDAQELLKAALTSNNYSTIVTWVNKCDAPAQKKINMLAQESNTNCFMYCAQ